MFARKASHVDISSLYTYTVTLKEDIVQVMVAQWADDTVGSAPGSALIPHCGCS